MKSFHVIEDGAAITLCKGIWRQSKIYRRNGVIYAQHGGGYIRLFRGGGTSIPHVSWKEIDAGAGEAIEDASDLSVRYFEMGAQEAAE